MYNLCALSDILEINSVTFRYPGSAHNLKPALDNISLRVRAGEFVAILGSNGSGKSTLARLCNGLLVPDSGSVLVKGRDTASSSDAGFIRQMIGLVFQHPENQIIAATVEEDIAFGPENLGLPSAEIRCRVDRAIDAVGLQAHRFRPPHLLSGGQMQRLALAGVLAMRPQCVIFDEATSMLDPAGRRMAFELMDELRAEGMAVLYITHDMDEASRAERLLILHEGKLVYDGSPRGAFLSSRLQQWGLALPPAAQLWEMLSVALHLDAKVPLQMNELLDRLPVWQGQHIAAHTGQPAACGEPVIEVANLEHSYLRGTPLAHQALSDMHMKVYSRCGHGLAGATGSGKSTLLQHLNGLIRPQSGRVRVGKLELGDPSVTTSQAVRQAGLVFQNPEMQFFETFVGDEVAYGPRQLELQGSLKNRVRQAMESVGLDFEKFKDRRVQSLSGGEKRKVALASILANQTPILLLDEPTAGLDPRAHLEILTLLKQLQSEGKDIVLSSHRMDDLAELTRNMTVCRKGVNVYEGSSAGFFSSANELKESGLEAPPAAQVASRLADLGWPITCEILTPPELAACLRTEIAA